MKGARRGLAFSLAIGIAGCGGGGGGGGFSGVPAQLIPNLRPLTPSDFRIEQGDTQTRGTHRLLRLSSHIANFGDGPMEIYGEIETANQMDIVPAEQVIHWNNGDETRRPAGDFEHHDVHSHWHWENLISFQLAEANNPNDPYDPANTVVGSTPKVTFCLLDTSRIPQWTGSRPNSSQYRNCNQNTQGISRGWFDTYSANLYGQWIIIDGLPDGLYWVINETDPSDLLLETDETDNRIAVKIQITGDNVAVVP
ncbi:MAG TPA: lysyl oxidase family protein [Fimbriimonadaceae bacterium]|nr:lysyl oxidase family protein [Fimbriimonadaceae bacterium]